MQVKATVGKFVDSLRNAISGIGGENDPNLYNTVGRVRTTRTEMTLLYKHYWLMRKVINIPIEDMLKNGRTITPGGVWDADKIAEYELAWKKLKVDAAITSAMRWAALYGGGAIIPVNDTIDLSVQNDPTVFSNGGIHRLVVLDAFELLDNDSRQFIQDLRSPHFKMPETFSYNGQRIHVTNLIPVHGEELPALEVNDSGNVRRFWGAGMPTYLKEPILRLEAAKRAVAGMMQQNNVDYLKVEGLYTTLSGCGDGVEHEGMMQSIIARALMFAKFKGPYNMAVMDKTEDIERLKYDFGGIPQILHELMLDITGGSDIPLVRMSGISPGGLNSTGESDLKNYNGKIEADQQVKLAPIYDFLDRFVTAHCFGQVMDVPYTINKPNPESETEITERQSKYAETINKIESMGILPEYLILRMLQAEFSDIPDDLIDELEAVHNEESTEIVNGDDGSGENDDLDDPENNGNSDGDNTDNSDPDGTGGE